MATPDQSEETLKDFADLHQDYAFFEEHSDETEASLEKWRPFLPSSVRSLLDFGCGSGSFTDRFLRGCPFPLKDLSLHLVEPEVGFRERAFRRLKGRFDVKLSGAASLGPEDLGRYDLSVTHHVLYYVPDLVSTVRKLASTLAPGGRLIVSQGGRDNGLNQIVFAAFDELGRRPPYHYSERTQELLEGLGAPYRLTRDKVRSVLRFLDTPENRRKILRFLLSQHLTSLAEDPEDRLLEPYRVGAEILIENLDDLFVLDRCQN